MTKEAKLQAAMRILPEWVGYDEEIKALQQKVENANRQTEKESGMSLSLTLRFLILFKKFLKCLRLFVSFFFFSETVDDVSKHEEL